MRSPADEQDEANATVFVLTDKHKAEVRLALNWPTLDPEQQRRSLVHELLHLHLDAMSKVVGAVESVLGTPTAETLRHAYDHENEVAAEMLARVIAPTLPMPPVA